MVNIYYNAEDGLQLSKLFVNVHFNISFIHKIASKLPLCRLKKALHPRWHFGTNRRKVPAAARVLRCYECLERGKGSLERVDMLLCNQVIQRNQVTP